MFSDLLDRYLIDFEKSIGHEMPGYLVPLLRGFAEWLDREARRHPEMQEKVHSE